LVTSHKFRQRRLLVLIQGNFIIIAITTTSTHVPTIPTTTYGAIHYFYILSFLYPEGATSHPDCWSTAASGYSIATKWRSQSESG